MKMTERGQITIPKTIREKCGFNAQTQIEVSLRNGVVIVERKRDMKKFDEALNKWQGSGAKRMKALGFSSTDDMVEALRGR